MIFQRLVCAVRGHEEYLHFDKNRVYLQCVACGYESPGWKVESKRPVLHFHRRRKPETPPAPTRQVA